MCSLSYDESIKITLQVPLFSEKMVQTLSKGHHSYSKPKQ